MAHSVRRHLRVDIEAYDDTIRRFIPGYPTMLARAAAAVASAGEGVVLDLGAGTGALTSALLSQGRSDQQIQLWDIDPEMLEQAQTRLDETDGRLEYRLKSFQDPFPECAAVMASLSLHHIPNLASKRELYARVSRALRPGGVFVNADITIPESDPDRTARYAEWADHLEANGIERARAFEHFAEWADEDTYFSLEQELDALEQAGFEATCGWRQGPSTLLVGRAS